MRAAKPRFFMTAHLPDSFASAKTKTTGSDIFPRAVHVFKIRPPGLHVILGDWQSLRPFSCNLLLDCGIERPGDFKSAKCAGFLIAPVISRHVAIHGTIIEDLAPIGNHPAAAICDKCANERGSITSAQSLSCRGLTASSPKIFAPQRQCASARMQRVSALVAAPNRPPSRSASL